MHLFISPLYLTPTPSPSQVLSDLGEDEPERHPAGPSGEGASSFPSPTILLCSAARTHRHVTRCTHASKQCVILVDSTPRTHARTSTQLHRLNAGHAHSTLTRTTTPGTHASRTTTTCTHKTHGEMNNNDMHEQTPRGDNNDACVHTRCVALSTRRRAHTHALACGEDDDACPHMQR